MLLPNMHRREGENRTDTAALMAAIAIAHGGEAVALGERQLRAVGREEGEVARVSENADLNRKPGLLRCLSKYSRSSSNRGPRPLWTLIPAWFVAG